MYCVKCKRKTESSNIIEVLSKNNRKMIKSTCLSCGGKKSSFIKTGKGIFNHLIGKIGELHLPANEGEYVPGGSFNNQKNYSYCGPGTKYEQRNREGYVGINELDGMCKLHDKFYNENQDTETRNVSDVALAHRADEIASDPFYDNVQRRDAKFVTMIMKNKARFKLGLKSKNSEKGPAKKK